jgi:NOL1/NOP2/fmu family ribosome biogenesis protein
MFLEQAFRQTSDSLENLHVLDLCGAPGGKSIHLSDLIGPESILISNEVIRSRVAVLSETVTKWGTGNILVTRNDPSAFGKLAGFFDVILIDAPCSGEGMFRTDVARKEWSVENSTHCSERQKRILIDVWPALKESGILIYSTCTFNPGENEENIRWLIDKKEAECIRLNVSDLIGITEIDFQGIYGYGFYPGRIRGEGFFISAIRKTGSQEKIRVRSQKKTEFKPDKNDLDVVSRWTHFSKDRMFKWGDELFAVPCVIDDYLHIYRDLKIVKGGTKLFTLKNHKYLPSNELALSIRLKRDAFPGNEIDLYEALSFMRRDYFNLNSAAKGWNILTYKGINLGFVNNIGNRVNNYFPVEWRIRMNLPEPGNENIINWENIDKL